MRELSPLIRLAKYGVIAIMVYGLFIIYIFFKNVTSSGFSDRWGQMHMFTSDFSGVAGNFSLAFFLHNCVCQVTSNNLKQENN